MKRIKAATLIILLTLLGCASVASYEETLQTWVGQSEQSLEASWGAPTSITQSGDTRLVTYIYNDGTLVVGSYRGPRVVSLYCTTTFSVVNGLITQANFQGNQCVAY